MRFSHPLMHAAGSVADLFNLDTTPVQLHTTTFQTGDTTGRGISSYLVRVLIWATRVVSTATNARVAVVPAMPVAPRGKRALL